MGKIERCSDKAGAEEAEVKASRKQPQADTKTASYRLSSERLTAFEI